VCGATTASHESWIDDREYGVPFDVLCVVADSDSPQVKKLSHSPEVPGSKKPTCSEDQNPPPFGSATHDRFPWNPPCPVSVTPAAIPSFGSTSTIVSLT
jgi:hypothetical protein